MEVGTIKKAFKIDRTHAKRSPAEAILLGLQVFGAQEDEAAMFRAWCALQLSEELAEIPHMKPSVLQAALRELEGLEWVIVMDEKQEIKIIV